MIIKNDGIEIVSYGEQMPRSLEEIAEFIMENYQFGLVCATDNNLKSAIDKPAPERLAKLIKKQAHIILETRILPALQQYLYLKTHQEVLGKIDDSARLVVIRSVYNDMDNSFIDAFSVTCEVMRILEPLGMIFNDKLAYQVGRDGTCSFELSFFCILEKECEHSERGAAYSVYAGIRKYNKGKTRSRDFNRPDWLRDA